MINVIQEPTFQRAEPKAIWDDGVINLWLPVNTPSPRGHTVVANMLLALGMVKSYVAQPNRGKPPFDLSRAPLLVGDSGIVPLVPLVDGIKLFADSEVRIGDHRYKIGTVAAMMKAARMLGKANALVHGVTMTSIGDRIRVVHENGPHFTAPAGATRLYPHQVNCPDLQLKALLCQP